MDASSFLDRALRYAKTSSTLGLTAARLASEKYLGTSLNHGKQAQILKDVLGNLKGPVMKVAQFLATVPGALPPEYADAFMTLQTHAPFMGSSFVKRRMAGELGPTWEDKFKTFEKTPSFAASLGQVHKAELHDGRLVACKLQYPDMQSAIDADLTQLKILLTLYEAWSPALKTEDLFEEIKEKLQEELDYENEAQHAKRYRDIFSKTSFPIHIPEIFSDYSTKRLLTMSWHEGTGLLDHIHDSQEDRNHYASLLFRAWYRPFYHHGVIHGDPHPGNYQITEEKELILFDFGCVRIFQRKFIQGVIHLYEALKHHDEALMVHAYESWGFKNLTKEVIDIMNRWAKMLYEPLLDDRIRPIQEKIVGWDIASGILNELSRMGGIRPPKEFVFMDRAAVGIGSVIFRLGAELNWHRLFEEIIETIPQKETLEERSPLDEGTRSLQR